MPRGKHRGRRQERRRQPEPEPEPEPASGGVELIRTLSAEERLQRARAATADLQELRGELQRAAAVLAAGGEGCWAEAASAVPYSRPQASIIRLVCYLARRNSLPHCMHTGRGELAKACQRLGNCNTGYTTQHMHSFKCPTRYRH